MKLPFVLRKTHEAKLKTTMDGLKCKSKLINSLNSTLSNKLNEINLLENNIDDLEAEIKGRDILRDSLLSQLEEKDAKVKQLEEYIEKLEKVLENKTLINCSLNTKLIAKDEEYKKLVNANKILIKGFNNANRKNWCNEESKRQLKKLAEDILEVDKINKTEVASYLLNIAKYMGGGEPINLQWVEENTESNV